MENTGSELLLSYGVAQPNQRNGLAPELMLGKGLPWPQGLSLEGWGQHLDHVQD